ncbi:MAG: hypothetical protein Q4B54_04065, partial [Coriobacteriales bacterium]|nr:hypothetical protein [Coriobacteriales bacterium]
MFADKYTYETRAVSNESRANKYWYAMMALLSALLACAVFAAGTRVALAATTDWGKLQDAITAASSGSLAFDESVASVTRKTDSDGNKYMLVTLNQDVTATTSDTTPLSVSGDTSVVLDLGSYSINRGLKSATANGCVISNTGTLTIKGSGKITGGNNSTTDSSSGAVGGGIYNAGALTLDGGDVCGNTSAGNGGGIYLSEASYFIMTQGTIDNNKVGESCSGKAIYTEASDEDNWVFPYFKTGDSTDPYIFFVDTNVDGSTRTQL